MPDLSINKYLFEQVNRNVIINPYKFVTSGGGSSLLTGLAHWWDLLGNANDSVGGANLTTSESFTGTSPSGDTNCINFDGTGGASETTGAVSGASRTEISIGIWFKATNFSAARSVWYYGSGDNQSLILVTSGVYRHRIGGTNDNGPTLSSGTWYCEVFTATAGAWASYINDSLSDSGSASFNFAAGNTWDLGNLATTDFLGPMCCCAIWDRILTAEEITEFYNGGTNLKYSDL